MGGTSSTYEDHIGDYIDVNGRIMLKWNINEILIRYQDV